MEKKHNAYHINDDLDAVLENINLLIGDMEDNLNSSAETLLTTITPSSDRHDSPSTSNENLRAEDEYVFLLKTKDNNRVDLSHAKDKMESIIPIIHHEFSSDLSLNSTHSHDSDNHDNNLKVVRETIDKLQSSANYNRNYNKNNSKDSVTVDPKIGNRNSFEMQRPNHTRFLREQSKRLYNSANNSPVILRKTTNRASHGHFRERTNSITPRLSMPNIEKFDIEVMCPDDNSFKAGVFKAWTAFQLAWKIAHVKGMAEKLALVVKEYIVDLHLTRTIEDHEVVYSVMQNWAPNSNNQLQLVEDINKYDLFNDPAAYLPIEILDLENTPTDPPTSTKTASRRSSLLMSIMTADRAPDLHGWVYMKDFDKKSWRKVFMRLRKSSLYACKDEDDLNGELIYVCESSYLYNCEPEFITAHKAPDKFCFCTIPDVVTDWSQIKCVSTASYRLLVGWTSGIRLAKYGQQLYMNFREAMTKEANLRRTNSARQSILVRRSYAPEVNIDTRDNKAALDFSGNSCRFISDPEEAQKFQNEIAFEIPKTAKRRSGGTFSPAVVRKSVLENKPWYHGKINREEAIEKLEKNGLKDGLFLVRDSSSSHGNLVLTVVNKNRKIHHHQIFQSFTHSGVSLYGVEHGPQFSSLEYLIESYHSGVIDGADFALKKPCPLS